MVLLSPREDDKEKQSWIINFLFLESQLQWDIQGIYEAKKIQQALDIFAASAHTTLIKLN